MMNYIVYIASVDKVSLSRQAKAVFHFEDNRLDLIAGMAAGGLGIISRLNDNDELNRYILDTNADISTYRVLFNMSAEQIKKSVRSLTVNQTPYTKYLGEREYGVWIRNDIHSYNLYKFRSTVFLQGLFSICHMFGVNFRYYIYDFPFNKQGIKQTFTNYELIPFRLAMDVPQLNDQDDLAVANGFAEEEEEDWFSPDWDENNNIQSPFMADDDYERVSSGLS